MSFEKLTEAAKLYFPDLQIKYKDKSTFMKIISALLFFNKDFYTKFVTTIGSTVYFPNEDSVNLRPLASSITLMHECVHVYDSKKYKSILFKFLYLTPQIFSLLAIPFYLLTHNLFSLLFVLFLLPWPSYFRMLFEKRAYMISLYCLYSLGKKLNFKPVLNSQTDLFLNNFRNQSYYFMWPFKSLKNDFDKAVDNINNNKYPFEDPVFEIIDILISKM